MKLLVKKKRVHPFFTTFFADQLWASSFLVVSDHQSSNFYYFTYYCFPYLLVYTPLSILCFFRQMFVSGYARICEPNTYIYIICLLIDRFMPLLFVYQLNSFSTAHKYLLQRNSLPVAIKCGLYHFQMISGSIVITK